MSEKAQRLYDLMREWNAVEEKPDFIRGGLTCIYVNKGSLYVNKHGVMIKDRDTVILEIKRVLYPMVRFEATPWRTTVYEESYSDRIDALMAALAKAIEFEEIRF